MAALNTQAPFTSPPDNSTKETFTEERTMNNPSLKIAAR